MIHARSVKSILMWVAVPAFLGGCGMGGMGEMTVGGRPLIYKQGPGDPPESIQTTSAGGPVKRETPAPVPARSAARAAEPERPGAAITFSQFGGTTPVSAGTSAGAGLPVPEVFGGYTQSVRHGGLVFISGQIAVDPRTGAFDAAASIDAQTRQVMENLRTVLENNKMTFANLASVTVYLSTINNLGPIDRIYHSYFTGPPPARTVVEVAHLPRGALIELSAIAGR